MKHWEVETGIQWGSMHGGAQHEFWLWDGRDATFGTFVLDETFDIKPNWVPPRTLHPRHGRLTDLPVEHSLESARTDHPHTEASPMKITRRFIDWQQPALVAVVNDLVAKTQVMGYCDLRITRSCFPVRGRVGAFWSCSREDPEPKCPARCHYSWRSARAALPASEAVRG